MRTKTALLFSLTLVFAACSAPEPNPSPDLATAAPKNPNRKTTSTTSDGGGTSSQGNGTTPGSPPPNSGGTTTDAGTGGPGTPASNACAGEKNQTACYGCCETQNPQGLKELYAAFQTCACANGAGSCAAECAGSYCAGGEPTALCADCLDTSTACENQADTACLKTPACAALFACDDGSKCVDKPGP